MKKISRNIFFIKKIFPIIWLGLPAFITITAVMGGAASQKNGFFFLAPIIFGCGGYLLMKKMLGDLADEVYDCGSCLLVKNGNEKDEINLSDVMNVSVTTTMNPPRISLRLRKPGKFGDEVSFSPVANRFSFNPFAKNAIAEDLIVRVDQANLRNAR